MKKITSIFFLAVIAGACNQSPNKSAKTIDKTDSIIFHKMLDNYWDERMQLFPLEATTNGDNRFNDQLRNDGSAAFLKKSKDFFTKYSEYLKKIDRNTLSDNDKISFDIFNREMSISLEGFNYHPEYMPINQFWSLPLSFPQLGSGEGNQPFVTVKDYDNFLGRITGFSIWTDTAIANMRTGIRKGYVLPKALVEKIIPQMESIPADDVTKSIFYGPINKMPSSFSDADKKRLTEAYAKAINDQINKAYKKLGEFFKDEYLPKARTTSGIDTIPQGKETYQYLIRYWTTTDKTPDEVFNLGLQEVATIRAEMEKVKNRWALKAT